MPGPSLPQLVVMQSYGVSNGKLLAASRLFMLLEMMDVHLRSCGTRVACHPGSRSFERRIARHIAVEAEGIAFATSGAA